MRNLKVYAVALFLGLSFAASAQQDAQFSHYMFNGLYYNPGYAGVERVTRFNLINRVQWLNYDPTDVKSSGLFMSGGAPQSFIVSANSNLYRADGNGKSLWDDLKLGTGIYLLHESIGPLRNTDFEFSLSKHIDISNGVLGLGLSGGVFSQRIDPTYKVVQENDPIYQYLVNEGAVSQTKGDLSAGAWYEHKRYYLGASFNHIPRSKFTYGSNIVSSRISNHLYVTAGYKYKIGTLVITPSFIVQSDLNQLTYLFGGLVEYNKRIWGGVNVRQSLASRDHGQGGGKTLSNDDVILYIGMNMLKNTKNIDVLRIGYAFDFVTSGVYAKNSTSHEIMLSYLIPNPFGPAKPPIRTPRYRHEN